MIKKWSGTGTSLKFPISALTKVIPDINLSIWKKKGIARLDDVMEGSILNTLQQEYQLPLTGNTNTIQIYANSSPSEKEPSPIQNNN